MCTLAAVATFAVGAVQSMAQYSAQKEEHENNRVAAVNANEQDQATLTQRQLQEDAAASDKVREQTIAEAVARSEVAVTAAGAGVSGISVENLKADMTRRAAGNRSRIEENARNVSSQLQLEKVGAASRAQSRINSVPRPSPLSLVAGIGGAALGGYNAYKKYSLSPT